MHATRIRQRLTIGAAIAGCVAALLARHGQVSEVRVAPPTPLPAAAEWHEKRCFDALRPELAKPGWKITIERGSHDCFGSIADEAFDIDSDGHVLWKAQNMPDRRVDLSLGERPLLEGIVDVSCAGEIEHHEENAFLAIYPAGQNRDKVAEWPIQWSPARETLEMLVLRLKTRYAEERREKLGAIALDLRVREEDTRVSYRTRITDDVMVVTRGTKLVLRKALTKDEIVELVDLLGYQGQSESSTVHGTLVAGGTKATIALDSLWKPVLSDAAHAIHCDSHLGDPWICD